LRGFSRAFVAAAIAALAIGAGSATAGSTQIGLGALTQVHDIVSGGGSCTYGAPSRVFLPWLDLASYALAPEGDLSATDQWHLSGTSLVADHDPWTAGSVAIALPDGSSATTPSMCVGLINPTIRFFVNNGAGRSSDLRVDLVYQSVLGGTTITTLGRVRTTGPGWQPSPPLMIGVNLLSAVTAGGYATVSFLLTPEGASAGSWEVDSIYVDPFRFG
jgi:hypothetical protein